MTDTGYEVPEADNVNFELEDYDAPSGDEVNFNFETFDPLEPTYTELMGLNEEPGMIADLLRVYNQLTNLDDQDPQFSFIFDRIYSQNTSLATVKMFETFKDYSENVFLQDTSVLEVGVFVQYMQGLGVEPVLMKQASLTRLYTEVFDFSDFVFTAFAILFEENISVQTSKTFDITKFYTGSTRFAPELTRVMTADRAYEAELGLTSIVDAGRLRELQRFEAIGVRSTADFILGKTFKQEVGLVTSSQVGLLRSRVFTETFLMDSERFVTFVTGGRPHYLLNQYAKQK